MPVYVKGDHEVNVSGGEEVARYVAAGYTLADKVEAPSRSRAKSTSKKSE